MQKHFLLFSLISLALVMNSCTSSAPKVDSTAVKDDPALSNTMQGLKAEMDRLLPLAIDPKAFNAPENQKLIQQSLINIETVSAHVTHSPAMNEKDPTLNSLSQGFHEEAQRSREAFEQGKREYARGNILNATSYCVECHTRTTTGPSFQTPEVEKTLKSLRPLDRGEYLLAIRQYDGALKEFDDVIKAGMGNGTTVFDLDRAIRMALSITVRFKSDPAASMKIVDDVLGSQTIPYYLKTTAKSWKEAIQDWKKESKRSRKDLVKFCQELVHKGRSRQQGRDDHAGDIEMMRVQALLHPTLSSEKNPARLGQSLYLVGVAYESVKDLAMWSLHEDYFESCIRKAPHSEWSALCYKKLEESVLLGYTGSAGTSIPADEEKRLSELQKLAL